MGIGNIGFLFFGCHMNTKSLVSLFLAFVCLATFSPVNGGEIPSFTSQTIDDRVQIGYGIAIGDVDGDGRLDIVLADKKQFVWYQNPSWQKHVIAENLTERDNVCLAVRDINGDGKVEIAVGAQWNPGDTNHSGAVFYLIPPAHRTKKWSSVQLHHEPVVHRMRWLKIAKDQFVLVVSPLHGRGNRGGTGAGVRLLAYQMPDDPRTPWKTTVLEDSMHVTHNLDPVQWDPTTEAEELLYLGREGAMLISYENENWSKKKFPLVQGGGEIRMGLFSQKSPFIVTVEPFHGDKLVFYKSDYQRGENQDNRLSISRRIVLDDNLGSGHAIATADVFGNGSQQVVAGWRTRNRDSKVGIKLYYPIDDAGTRWNSAWIDDNTMATEDIRVGDLNADGRPDIVAAGRATHNLKIYWNQGFAK